MSDSEDTPTPDEAPAGPPAPFWVRGSDGSERGPYADLELAQATKANVEGVHAEDGVSFVLTDKNGDPIA